MNRMKLGEILSVKHGWAFKGEYFAEDGEQSILTPGNFFEKGGFKPNNGKERYYTGTYPKEYLCHKGDLIVAMTQQAEGLLGSTALVPENNKYLHNQRIGLITCDEKRLNKLFAYYLFMTKSVREQLERSSSGTKVKHTSPEKIYDVEVEIPDVISQQKIANLLWAIDEKIANNKAINDNLEQQAAALFSSLYNRSNTEVRYTDLIQILGGGTPKTGETAYWNGNIAFFTPKDVGTPYTFITEKTITEEGLSHCNSRLYPVNTVFVTARGTVGKVGLSGIPMAMNQSCYALVGKETHQLLVYFYTLKAVDRLKHKASGAVFDAITTRDFDSEQIMKLSDDDAKAFLCVAEPMFQEMLNNSIENLRLSTLRDFLLPKLMSGEIDVSSVQL